MCYFKQSDHAVLKMGENAKIWSNFIQNHSDNNTVLYFENFPSYIALYLNMPGRGKSYF